MVAHACNNNLEGEGKMFSVLRLTSQKYEPLLKKKSKSKRARDMVQVIEN
jgi:hypothetical protein